VHANLYVIAYIKKHLKIKSNSQQNDFPLEQFKIIANYFDKAYNSDFYSPVEIPFWKSGSIIYVQAAIDRVICAFFSVVMPCFVKPEKKRATIRGK